MLFVIYEAVKHNLVRRITPQAPPAAQACHGAAAAGPSCGFMRRTGPGNILWVSKLCIRRPPCYSNGAALADFVSTNAEGGLSQRQKVSTKMIDFLTHPAVFAALIGGFLLLYVHRRNRLAAASSVFRAAFNTDIAEIANPSRLPDDKVYVFLAQHFSAHKAAILEFSAYLNSRARCRLIKDWSTYASSTDEIRQRYDALSGTAEAEARRKLAVERLQKIVSHGSET